jgi:hypothetical protein
VVEVMVVKFLLVEEKVVLEGVVALVVVVPQVVQEIHLQ